MSYMLSILEVSNKNNDKEAISPRKGRGFKNSFNKAFWVFLVLFNVSAVAGLQAQTITSATYFDTNGDGNIDEVLITADQPINDLTIVLTDFVFEGVNPSAVATGGTLGNSTDPDTPNDNLVTFDVSITGTEALLTATFTTGNLQNLSATDFLDNTDITRVDLALPVFLSATAVSDILIQLQYSEAVTATFTTAGDWTATGITVSNAAQNGSNTSIIDLTVSPLNDGTFTASDLALVINDDVNDQITDVAGNLAADISGQSIADGQLPVFISATATSNTTIELLYSEPVTAAFSTGGDWTATGMTVTNAAQNGGNTSIIDLTVNDLANTGFTASDLALVINDDVNDRIVDASGNLAADISGQSIADGQLPVFISAAATSNTTIELLYSEPVTAAFATAGDWTATGITVSNAAQNGSNTSIIDLTVSPLNDGTFTASDLALVINDDVNDQIVDVAGNLAADISGQSIADGQSPVFISATATSNTTIELLYSEPVTATFTTAGDWTATGITVSNAAQNGSNTSIIDLTVSPLNDGTFTASDLALVINDDVNDQIIDVAGNLAADISGQSIADGQLPVFISATATSNTTIELLYNEPVTAAFSTGGDWTATGMTVTNAAQNSGNTSIIDLTVNDLANTGFTASDLALVINDDLNDRIVDASGNLAVDISGQSIADGQLPVFISAAATSNTTIELLYSEPVTATFTTAGDWTATGITVSNAAQNGSNTSIIDLTVSALNDGTFTASDLALVINDDVNDQIVDVAGNLATDISGQSIADGQLPTFLSAIQFDTNGDGNIDEIVIEMSEDFDNATLDVNDFGLSAGSISSVSDDGVGTDNTTDAVGDEFFTLEVSVTGTAPVTVGYASDGLSVALADLNGNAAADNATITSDDQAFPVITSVSALDANNAFIDVTFSEGIFNDAGAAVETSDFDAGFMLNGSTGSITNVVISSLRTTGDAMLIGGESTIRFNLSQNGVSDGLETINISPLLGAIEDNAGNAMSAAEETGDINLNAVNILLISSVTVAPDNSFVDVEFSETVERSPSGNVVRYGSNFEFFTINFNDPGTSVTFDPSLVTITNTSGGAIATTDDVVRFDLSAALTGVPTGDETFDIQNRPANRVRGGTSGALLPSGQIIPVTLNDARSNIISATYFDTNGDGNIDEVVITADDPIDDLTVVLSDFVFEGANPDGVTAAVNIDNPLDPGTGDDVFITFDVSITGTETTSTATFSSGNLQNASGVDFSSNTDITRVDRAAPVVINAIAVDNTTIQLVYGEDINLPTLQFTDGITISGGLTVSAIALNGLDNSIVELTVSSIGATDYTGTIDLTIDANDVIEDATGNDVANLVSFAINDGQAPEFVNSFQFDTDGDGSIDEIVIEISELFDNATLDFNDFGLTAGTVDGISDNGAGTANILDGDNDEFFTLEVTIAGTAVETVDYTENAGGTALEDIAGNLAADDAAILAEDRAAPAFSFTTPSDGATNVSVTNQIVFELSEVTTASPGTFIRLFRDAAPAESIEVTSANVNIAGTTVTVTLSSLLSKGSSYSVSIDAGAFDDASGNTSVLDATWNWDMEAIGTPNIVGTFPANGQTEVPIGANIQIFLDQEVRYQNASATDGGGGADPRLTIISAGDPNFGAGGRDYTVQAASTDAGFSPAYIDGFTQLEDTITFSLSTASTNGSFTQFLPNTTYTIEIGSKTFEYNPTGEDAPPIGITETFTFTTVSDASPPMLLGDGIASFEPDDQAGFTNTVNANTTTQLDIIFNEDVAEGTGNIQLFLDTNDDGVSDATVFDITTTNPAVSFVPENLTTDKLRIDLSTLGISLSGGVSYFVNVDSDAVLDDSGNTFAGFNNATTWNFTTLTEGGAPSLVALTPGDNSTGVAIDASFTLQFDEVVTIGTVEEVRLFLGANDQLIETVQASALSVVNDEITIDFVNDLSGFTDYYITIESGAIRDFSGNAYAGFSGKNNWNFKTISGTDLVSPVVTALSPADGATDQAVLPAFSIAFNEPIFPATGNFYIRDGGIVETFDVTSDVNISGNIVTFTSSVVLTNNTAYTVDWDPGVVTDSEGNAVANVASQAFITGTWDFTTIADTDAPVIVSQVPANDETGVMADANFSLVINFDEAVDIGTGNLELFYNDGTTLAPSQSFAVSGFVLSNSDRTATITIGPLDGATEYYVSLPSSAFVDEAVPANNVAGIDPNGSWSFTTAADASLPTITTLNPVNSATNVDLNGNLTLTFSERIFAGVGNIILTSLSQTILIDVADGTQISGFGTNQITVNPDIELFNNEVYTVSVDPAAIEDASGNIFNPATLTWSFTTETASTVTAGTIDLCEGADFVTLSDIVIDENTIDNFAIGNDQTIVLNLPDDFEFNFGVGGISGPSGDITATSLAGSTVNSLTITYSVGSATSVDQITISGLEVIYNGSSALSGVNVVRSGTGIADIKGNQALQAQPYILLSTNLAPGAPLIEDPAATGTFLTELAVESLAGSTFDLQVNSAVGGSTYNWENAETNSVFTGDALDQSDLVASADYVLTTDNLYSFDVTETDANGCVSPATRFNIFNYDLTLTPNVTAFSEDDDTGTVITISKPANHSAVFSGTALGGVTIPADGDAGNAEATFVPSTAGSTGSPYQITYSVTNLNTGETFDFTDGLNFTVSSLVTIFTNTVATEYCFTNADTNNDIDLDVSITPPNFYFYRIALFDDSGNEVVNAITPANTSVWASSGIVTRFSTSFPPVARIVAGNHFTSENWILNPSLVPAAGNYEIRYFIIRDNVQRANIAANEILFRTQAIEIFGLPTVELTNFTNPLEFFCEDGGLVTIEASVNSSIVTVDGYTIRGTSDAANGLSANIIGEQIDLSDPLGNGLSYATSNFRINYTSDAADDINGCVNTTSGNFRNLAKPAAPALTAGTDLGTEILFEFCVGETIPDFEISSPEGSPTEYYWQDNNGTIPTLDTLNEGTTASVFDLFNQANPSAGEYSFTVKRSDFTNNPFIDGCASDVTDITVIIYDQPLIPVLDLSGSTAGDTFDFINYEFNYCEGDTYEDFILFNDLNPGSPDSLYFWLNEDRNLIPSTTFADPINLVVTPAELGLDMVDLSSTFDTTFYVTSGEYINSPQFVGCFSDTITINITIHANPAAPAPGDTSVDFFTEYYACEGDATVTGDGTEQLAALRTPEGVGETYNWYEDDDGTGSNPGVFIATSNSIPLTDLSSAFINLDLNTAGVYYFWVTRVADANPVVFFDGCESPATRIAITVYPTATAPNVTNAQGTVSSNFAYAFCEGEITTATEFNLDQTFTPFMGGAGLERSFNWYQSNSSGAITNPTAISVASADGSTATAVELGLVGATPQIRYFLVTHVENIRTDGNFNGCESGGSLIQIDIQDVPSVPTVVGGNIFEYCNGDVVSNISVTGEGNAGEIFTWYDSDGLQVFQGATATAADLSIVSALPATVVDDSVYTFTVTQTQDIDFNGFTFAGCEGTAETFEVIIHPIPVQPVVSVAGSLEICVTEGLPTLSLSNQLPGATVSWRNSMGMEVSTASNFDPVIDNSVASSNTFTVIQIVDNCPSPATSVTINISAFPGQPVITGNTAADVYEFCAESDLSAQTLDISSPNPTSTYTWYAGATTASPLVTGASIDFVDLDFASTSLDVNTAGTTSFFVRETNAEGCEGDAKIVQITINPLPVLTISNLVAQYCFDDAAFTITGLNNAAALSGGTATFSINTGGLTDNGDGTADIDPQAAALAAGETREGNQSSHTVTFTYTDDNSCQTVRTFDFVINPQPVLTIEAPKLVACFNDGDILLQGVVDGVDATGGAFSLSTASGLTDNGDGTATFSPATAAMAAGETETGNASTHMVTFTLTDANTCQNSTTITLTVNPRPELDVVLGSDITTSIDELEVCYDDSEFVIRGFADGALATSGTFSSNFGGLTVNTDGTAMFNPSVAAISAGETREGNFSTHEITYSFTDALGCENSVTYNIYVNPQPTLDMVFQSSGISIEDQEVCFDADPINIIGLAEFGGFFSDVIADNISINTGGLTYDAVTGVATLDPTAAALAASGTATGDVTEHIITMTFSDVLGCSNTISYNFSISPLPDVSIRNEDGSPLTTLYCQEDDPVVFQAFADNVAVTSGVSYTLEGSSVSQVNGQITFSPRNLDADTLTLVMSYQDPVTQCTNSVTEEIVISPLPVLDIVLESNNSQSIDGVIYCFDDAPVLLRGIADGNSAVSGVFSISTGGITDNQDGTVSFDPARAARAANESREGNISTHQITFTYTDSNTMCQSSITSTITVAPQPALDVVFDENNASVNGSNVCFDDDTFIIRGRFNGTNDALSGTFTISTPNTSGGFVDNGNGTATFNPSVISLDNGANRTTEEREYKITFTYSDNNLCENTLESTITIKGQPEISFTGSINGNDEFTADNSGSQPYETCVVPINFFLEGDILEIDLRGSNAGGTFSGPGVSDLGNGNARFTPLIARNDELFGAPTDYVITYTFNETDNGVTCTNSVSQVITVNPIPLPSGAVDDNDEVINLEKSCFGQEAIVSIDILNIDEAELTYQWFIDGDSVEGATSNVFVDDLSDDNTNSRERFYEVVIEYSITANTVCQIRYFRNVSLGAVPDPIFKWDFVTAGSNTVFEFSDNEFTKQEFRDQFFNIEFYIVDNANDTIYRSDTDATFTAGIGDTFEYEFPNQGAYTVHMIVNSVNGCSTTVSRIVNIAPYIVLNESNYGESFEGGNGGWFTDSVNVRDRFRVIESNSWELGVPQGTEISGAGEGSRAWVTDLDGTYANDELSYLYSPTFDIRQIDRPTVSFLRFLDFDTNDDGAILQFSTDRGVTWSNLGDASDDNNDNILEQSGINWYNNLSVRGFLQDPSNPTIVGWTADEPENEGEWVLSIHKLDLPAQNADSVRFRFAVGTNADGVAEGFGLDNFRIFNRDRLSVIETFSTVLSPLSIESNDSTFSVLNNPELLLSDVVWLNYFNDFENNRNNARTDPLNDRNQIVPGTISTLYGVSRAPRAVINGVIQEEVVEIPEGQDKETFDLLGWSENDLSISSLSEPLVEIEVNEMIVEQDEINLDIRVVSNVDFPGTPELTTRIFIVESRVDPEDINPDLVTPINNPVYNVVREMLPDPDGFNFVGTINANDVIGEYTVNWPVSNTYHPDRLKAVVYVQDEGAALRNQQNGSEVENIFQVAVLDIAPKVNVITGIEEQFLLGEEFALYPNPASDQVNVVFNKPVKNVTMFNLVDQTGKVLAQGELPVGTKEFPIRTEKLAGGVYFVNVMDENVTLKPRRLIIIPR